jgi:hypothetical protein
LIVHRSSFIVHTSGVWLTSTDPLPRAVAIIALVVYIGVVGFVALHHEPWRDEADPWLAARDASAGELLQVFRHGGTPGLWYFLLIPLARSGAPYFSQHVLHIAVAASSAALILFVSPFPRFARLLIPLGYFFAYEYAVIARTYALSVLLLFAIAALYRHRDQWPVSYAVCVALLANTNIHSLCIATLIGVVYLLDSRRNVSAILIMLAGGAAALFQIWPAPDAMVHGAISTFRPEAPLLALRGAFFPNAQMAPGIALILGLAILIAGTIAVSRSRGTIVILWGSYAVLTYIFTLKWIGGVRHLGFVLLVLLFVLWIAEVQPRLARVVCWSLLTVSFLWSLSVSILFWRLDTRFAFSGAEEVAMWIRQHGMAGRTIAGHSETTASALAPYFDHPLWYPGIEAFGTFSKWDGPFARGLDVSYPEAVRRVEARFSDRSRLLLLLNVEMPSPEKRGWRLLVHNRRPQFANFDEMYWLYEATHP